MYERVVVAGCLAFASIVFVSGQATQPQRPAATRPAISPRVAAKVPVPEAPASDVATQRTLINRYCVVCHNQKLKTANLLLDQLDLAYLAEHAEIAEKVIRKLRAGMMPPAGMPRPDPVTREALIAWLENEVDRHAVPSLSPPGIHRLNRAEYSNAIRDVVGLDVDATKFLPPDDSTHGFDNIAGALRMSPALLEAYLSAAGKISRLAVGSDSTPAAIQYSVPEDLSQNSHIEGLPFGTRGGILFQHNFPVAGEYIFHVIPVNEGLMGGSSKPFGQIKGEQLEVMVDGERVHLFDWDKDMGALVDGLSVVRSGAQTPRIPIKAGPHAVGVTFLDTHDVPDHNLNKLFERTTIETGGLPGLFFYPHVGLVRVEGPYNPAGAADTPSRRKIFVCRPVSANDEEACARKIMSALATRAFRRPATLADVGSLMEFYLAGRNEGDFDHGIEGAVQRILVDPAFIFRREIEPATLAAGKTYRLSDLELASRLSFFLWSTIPDQPLLTLAVEGKLKNPMVLEQQVQRMLADPRSQALVRNFTGQWLNVRALQDSRPIALLYPDFDANLREAFRTEIELFFDSLIQEDQSILDLLTADYTFVNERLAKHYGIPNVYGSHFRRVTLGPELDMRRGLLGKGALMLVTSTAARTSPVARGKWFLQTFLAVSPPDPPPNVPAVKEKKEDIAGNAKEPTMRQRMDEHHTNPVCASCHKIFEPIGFTLENFDATGAWRTEEDGTPIDVSGQFVDGIALSGPASLRDLLQRYSPQFVRAVTERLMTYALGRGIEYTDMPLLRSIVHDAAPNNYRFSSLVLGIVKSAAFQTNRKIGGGTQQQAAR